MSVFLVLLLTLYQHPLFRQVAAQDEEQNRDIESTEVTHSRRRGRNQRPGQGYSYRVRQSASTNRANVRPHTGKTAMEAARQQFPIGPPPKGKTYMTVGITLWRVRPATEAEINDHKVHIERMMWDQKEHEVVVTRISDDSPIGDKDLIQMSVEYLPDRNGEDAMPPNRAGYLYVINREQFPDGSLKNGRLIFPTRLTYGGDNRVLPGKTVTLPDPGRPFRIKRDSSGQAQAYETYTIILSPEPMDPELPQEIGRSAMELPPNLLSEWERQWSAGESRADLRGGVGQARTQRELEASGDPGETRSTEDSAEDLTQDDPPPQIVFRKVVKPGSVMLFTIRLPFRETATKS
jgi:hypothetical protein